MILTRINYYEHLHEPNYWEIRDVNLGYFNLIVGLNATGKTRLINIVTNFAKVLSKKTRKDGHWELEFKIWREEEINYKYELEIKKQIIQEEEISENGKVLLRRKKDKGEIFSKQSSKMIPFSPPKDELTLNVRRDVKEFPFLEDFIYWANNFHGYTFSGVRPNVIMVPGDSEALLENLHAVPYLFSKESQDEEMVNAIIKDFSHIGYPIEEIGVRIQEIPPHFRKVFMTMIKEKDLNCTTEQAQMSQGMYRALSLIVIIEYIFKLNRKSTVVIDDLGEGLDYDRSAKLTHLLFDKIKGSNIQLIVTSNDRFLVNSIDIKHINFLERKRHVVRALNYHNSKEKFDEFIIAGLNNFDFFRGKMYD